MILFFYFIAGTINAIYIMTRSIIYYLLQVVVLVVFIFFFLFFFSFKPYIHYIFIQLTCQVFPI